MWLVPGFYHPAMPSASIIGNGVVLHMTMTMASQLNDSEKLAKKLLSFTITITFDTRDTIIISRHSTHLNVMKMGLETTYENYLPDTVDWSRKWLVDFNAGKTQLVSFDRSKNTGAIDVKMDGSVLEEKTSFKMLGLTFSSKLDWGSYIVSIAKTASKKIEVLIRSMNFLSPEVALYLYKSTIRQCMEYCCHVWAGARSCYLELLDKLQKRICRTVGPSLAASLESLAHRRNVASLSLF